MNYLDRMKLLRLENTTNDEPITPMAANPPTGPSPFIWHCRDCGYRQYMVVALPADVATVVRNSQCAGCGGKNLIVDPNPNASVEKPLGTT